MAPRIYIACLASYNAGRLYGAWFDLDVSEGGLQAAVKDLIEKSPTPGAEEWAIHDSEGFGAWKVPETASLHQVLVMARHIQIHGLAFPAYVAYHGLDPEHAVEEFEDAYSGTWPTVEAYAEEVVTDTWEIPENIAPYIDWEAVARDLFINDYIAIEAEEGGVYVFYRM